MKKLFLIAAVCAAIFCLFTACSKKTAAEKTGSGKVLIGYTVPDTSESFLSDLTNSVKQKFAVDGVDVEIANASGDSATQISQIENFATAGAKLIIVMAVDPTSVTDAIKCAQAAGSLVLTAGSNPGAYDAIMATDQYEDGKLMAKMAADWINKTFPGAKDGSVGVAILESRDTPEANSRCDGMKTIEEQCSKAKIVNTIGGIKKNDTAQAAMENIMQVTPNINVVLTYNSGGSIGVNEYVMRPDSAIRDKSKFASFCSDVDPQALSLLSKSGSNESVIRGIVKFGSADLAGDTYRLAKKMINGEPYNKENPDPLTPITVDNAAQFMQ
ncbi:MAG TPA: hypothetical protein DCL73_14490 [Treponema sp.]|nr:hypothetical protein [Treponema sp.]